MLYRRYFSQLEEISVTERPSGLDKGPTLLNQSPPHARDVKPTSLHLRIIRIYNACMSSSTPPTPPATSTSMTPQPTPAGPSPTTAPVVDSKSLLGDSREVLIRHADLVYRLSVTSQGKLILTK
jgi:hemin uptake protein HemP